jgi:hypothetical protein
MTLHTIRQGFVLTLLTFACGAHLFGQAGVEYTRDGAGFIRRKCRQSRGRRRNLDTGFARSAITDETGSFELPLLPVGRYEVTVKAPGFTTYQRKGVIVELARASDIAVRLAVAAEQQAVTTPPIRSTSSPKTIFT